MASVASRTGPLGIAIRGLFDNIGRLTTYATTFATLLAGRWVAGMAAAAISVRGLATALVVMRGALIRTGIGALIVGAGELIYQFGQLVSGAGGFGNAMALLGNLVGEVWERIKMGAGSFAASAMAAFADVQATSATAMQGALEGVVGFANAAVNSFEGAFEAIKAVWGLLPAAIGDLAFQAANSLIEGVEAMLNGVVSRINGFIDGVNAGLEALGVERRIGLIADLDLGQLENRFAGAATQAANAAQDAFAGAFADNPLAVPDLGLAGAATDAAASAEAWRQTAATLADGVLQPLEALEALRAAMRTAGTEAETALDAATLAADRFDAALAEDETGGPAAALDDTAAAAGRAGGALQSAADVARQSWDAARAAVERTQEIARGLADDITGPIKEALKSGELSWQTFASAISGIAQNLANRLIDNAFKPIEDALFRAFSGAGTGGGGGLFGWLTSALGGLFGIGGTFARGGAFGQAGEITAFASGGVVSRPTVFPFARGIGLMGEAGPEAILPLRRGRGGRLGVEASGEGQGAQSATRIVNVLDPSIVGDYLATPAGERLIVNVIRRNRGGLDA
jgi:lambda family phage tail tape measure protein